MKTLLFSSAVLSIITLVASAANPPYENAVWREGDAYRWQTTDKAATATTNLAEAINNCLSQGGGDREVHVLTGGELSATIGIPGDVKLFGHTNVFTIAHGGYSFHARYASNFAIRDLKVVGARHMVFRITGCDNVVLKGIHIDGGFIGMRIDSHASRPLGHTSRNLVVTDCRFENLGSHGIETFGIDGIYVDRIVARNNGQCGVLFNGSRNGIVGTIDAYRCCYGGGYAGLRFANFNANFRVKSLRAIECGRGFFTTTDAKNIVVEEVYIRGCSGHAILIQHSDQVGVNSGTHDGFVINHYTSGNCWVLATDATGVSVPPPGGAGTITAVSTNDRVRIDWPAVAGASEYRVQRATAADGPFFSIASTEAESFVDRKAEAGKSYWYRVRGVNAAGPGEPSKAVQATLPVSVKPVVDLVAGLRRHHAFDGSLDDAKGGAPVAIAGAANYAPGQMGRALALDGTSTFATLPALVGAEYRDFTFAAWVRLESDANWQRIFDFGSDRDNYMILTWLAGGFNFQIRSKGQLDDIHAIAPAQTLNRWTHVAVTFTGNRATLYINGAALKNVMFRANPSHLDLAVNYLGKSRWEQDALLKGRLDDVRLYTRALVPGEVERLVQDSAPMSPYDLVAGGFGTHAKLFWSGVENAKSYTVKRAESDNGPFTAIATGLAATTYADTAVKTGKTYRYVVAAVNPNGESETSNISTAVIGEKTMHLTFDEKEGITAIDVTGNGWNATLVNGATFTAGRNGNALDLPDTAWQQATLPRGVVAGLRDFTIAFWTRVDTQATWARVFDFGTGTDNAMFFTSRADTGLPRFAIRTPDIEEQQIDGDREIPTNAWVHVAIVREGTTGRLYVDGRQAGTKPGMTLAPSDLGLTTQNFFGRSQWPDPIFNGAIDDFRIYAKPLGSNEIAAIKEAGGTASGIDLR